MSFKDPRAMEQIIACHGREFADKVLEALRSARTSQEEVATLNRLLEEREVEDLNTFGNNRSSRPIL
ncbi:MAG: hypothetical protein NTY66_00675 [Candidatus Vogelbacteria bacterium]|nr:hypothetical protein [Candidatus Vogelbacteria bacterium]